MNITKSITHSAVALCATLITSLPSAAGEELTAEPAVITTQAKDKPYTSDGKHFFRKGNARIHGKMTNYDLRTTAPRLFLIYVYDLVTGESMPQTVDINPDGSFDSDILLPSPQTVAIELSQVNDLNTYLEPGNDLELILDREDMLNIDRGLSSKMEKIQFGGSLGAINRELYSAPDYKRPNTGKLSPDEAKDSINRAIGRWEEEINRYKDSRKLSAKSMELLDHNIASKRAYELLNYEKRSRYIAINDTTIRFRDPLPSNYYRDFLSDIMHRDTTFLAASNMDMLINRIGFGTMCGSPTPGISIYDTSAKETYLRNLTDSLCNLAGTDFVPLLWQMAITAREMPSTKGFIRSGEVEMARQDLNAIKNAAVPDPTLRNIIDQYCDSLIAHKAYEIPDTETGRIFRDIVAPHKGKLLVVDFWGTSCGPCRRVIGESKEFREKHRGNPDFKIIYITGEDESPRDSYDKYVARNLQGETCHYLPVSDIAKLRELFRMSAIPRYILIDRDGKIADDNFSFSNLQQTLLKEGIEL